MNAVTLFMTDIGITLVVSLLVVVYLRSPLRSILIDLCGTVERADFWATFSHVTLVLVPLIFAMHYRPELSEGRPAIFEVSAQLELALLGLVVSVVVMGLVIGSFIRRTRPNVPPLPSKVAP